MATIQILILIAFALTSILGGIVIGRIGVEFPVRRKIGYVAYAAYTRAADLGNGIWLYPLLAIGSLLCAIIAFLIGFAAHLPRTVLEPIAYAIAASVGVMATTAIAAPTMFRVGKAENKEELLRRLLDRFVRVNYIRAVFIWLQWAALLWTLYSVAH